MCLLIASVQACTNTDLFLVLAPYTIAAGSLLSPHSSAQSFVPCGRTLARASGATQRVAPNFRWSQIGSMRWAGQQKGGGGERELREKEKASMTAQLEGEERKGMHFSLGGGVTILSSHLWHGKAQAAAH